MGKVEIPSYLINSTTIRNFVIFKSYTFKVVVDFHLLFNSISQINVQVDSFSDNCNEGQNSAT